VTPFTADDGIDRAALEALVRFLLDEGADALMPTALTGEGPLLSESETLAVWEATFAEVGGARPVMPAIISFTTSRAVHLVRRAADLGAAAVMVAPIVAELYAGRSRSDVVAFYAAVADASDLPVALFNYPSLTGVDFTASFVEELVEIESIRYIKESTGDSKRVSALQRALGGRIQVICGAPTAALESFALGCSAWITGILNVVPGPGKALMEAVHERSDLELARGIYFDQILPLVDAMEMTSNPTGVIKAGLRARGVRVGVPRAPGQDLQDDEEKALRRSLERMLGAS
jgi:4-hydroxy-tetrahydrodipicolinate synthase